MIDRSHALPLARQCQVLSFLRSTAYYQRQKTSEVDPALTHRLDEQHPDCPLAGSRMLRGRLKAEISDWEQARGQADKEDEHRSTIAWCNSRRENINKKASATRASAWF